MQPKGGPEGQFQGYGTLGVGPGMYKIGVDIQPGEYVLLADRDYFQITTSSTGEFSSIVANGNFKNRALVTVANGQYLTVNSSRIVPIKDSPKVIPVNGKIQEGTYKIGVDIPPGEFKINAIDNGYFEIMKDTKRVLGSIVANGNFTGQRYVTVSEGQYINLANAELDFASRTVKSAGSSQEKWNSDADTEAVINFLARGVREGKLGDGIADPLMVKYNKRFQEGTNVYLPEFDWEIEDDTPLVETIEAGSVQFDGRRIPAWVVTAHFKAINRKMGKRRMDFVRLATAHDKDFKMWRFIQTWVNEAEANPGLSEWKRKAHFVKS